MQTDELLQFSKVGEKSLNQANLVLARPPIHQTYAIKPDIATMANGAVFLIPICFMMVWAVVAFISSDIWTIEKKGKLNVKHCHQVPCRNCRFFTNDPYLKCAVNPSAALTPQAINCSDYSPENEPSKLG